MFKISPTVLHAMLVALTGVLADIGAQVSSGSVDLTRSVIVGLIIGGASRILGAAIAASATHG